MPETRQESIPPYFHPLDQGQARQYDGRSAELTVHHLGEVELADSVVACVDPSTLFQPQLIAALSGKYQVYNTIANVEPGSSTNHCRVSSLSMVFTSVKDVKERTAVLERAHTLDSSPACVGVDAGTVSFLSQEAVRRLGALPAEESQRLSEEWTECVDHAPPLGMSWNLSPGENIIISESGWGDGAYPVYKALDEAGNVLALHIDFEVITDNPDSEPTVQQEALSPSAHHPGETGQLSVSASGFEENRVFASVGYSMLFLMLACAFARVWMHSRGLEVSWIPWLVAALGLPVVAVIRRDRKRGDESSVFAVPFACAGLILMAGMQLETHPLIAYLLYGISGVIFCLSTFLWSGLPRTTYAQVWVLLGGGVLLAAVNYLSVLGDLAWTPPTVGLAITLSCLLLPLLFFIMAGTGASAELPSKAADILRATVGPLNGIQADEAANWYIAHSGYINLSPRAGGLALLGFIAVVPFSIVHGYVWVIFVGLVLLLVLFALLRIRRAQKALGGDASAILKQARRALPHSYRDLVLSGISVVIQFISAGVSPFVPLLGAAGFGIALLMWLYSLLPPAPQE